MPTYSVPTPSTPAYPDHYKEPPLIDDRDPLEVSVRPTTRYEIIFLIFLSNLSLFILLAS